MEPKFVINAFRSADHTSRLIKPFRQSMTYDAHVKTRAVKVNTIMH